MKRYRRSCVIALWMATGVVGITCVRAQSSSTAANTVWHFDPNASLTESSPALAKLRPRIGLEIHTSKTQTAEDMRRQVTAAATLGFGFIRTDLFWERVETSCDNYDFSFFTPIVEAARENDLGILWTLAFGNSLYHTTPYGNHNTGPDVAAWRSSIDHYAHYAAAAAGHFAGVAGIRFELFNEPDRNDALSSPLASSSAAEDGLPVPELYEALAQTALKEMRKADPSALISTGGVSNFKVKELYRLASISATRQVTAIAVHPYRMGNAPETLKNDLDNLRAAIGEPGNPAARIWDTEWGYSTAGDFTQITGADGHSEQSRLRQAVFDVRELLTVWMLGLPVAVLYELQDGGVDGTNREDNFGLMDFYRNSKPAYSAVAALSSVAAHSRYVGHYTNLPAGLHAMRLVDESNSGCVIAMWIDRIGAVQDIEVTDPRLLEVTDLFGAPLRGASKTHFEISEAAGPIYLQFSLPPTEHGPPVR